MSDTGKINIIASNKTIFSIVFIVLLLGAMLLILPLYLQNQLNNLYNKSQKLAQEVVYLRKDVLFLELKVNQMTSLEALSGFATDVGLGLFDVPQKIMILEGDHE